MRHTDKYTLICKSNQKKTINPATLQLLYKTAYTLYAKTALLKSSPLSKQMRKLSLKKKAYLSMNFTSILIIRASVFLKNMPNTNMSVTAVSREPEYFWRLQMILTSLSHKRIWFSIVRMMHRQKNAYYTRGFLIKE